MDTIARALTELRVPVAMGIAVLALANLICWVAAIQEGARKVAWECGFTGVFLSCLTIAWLVVTR